jgi:tetratricopeptide (TPR) repeat protein
MQRESPPLGGLPPITMKATPVLLAVSTLALIAGCMRSSSLSVHHSGEQYVPPIASPEKSKQLVAFHLTRVRRDPRGAIGWSQLSAAYLDLSRFTDSYDHALAAENAARKSLKIRKRGNVGASCRLVQALLNQHRFADALRAARATINLAPKSPPAQQLLIECLLETGNYSEAEKELSKNASNLAEIPRKTTQSQLLELKGQPEAAAAMLVECYSKVVESAAAPEAAAWYASRVGDVHRSRGALDTADIWYTKALEHNPYSWKAKLGRCKVAALRKDWRAVVKFGHEAEEIAKMTDIVGLIGDGYRGLGDEKLAAEHYSEAAEYAGYAQRDAPKHTHGGKTHSSKEHGHPLDRQFAVFAADHNMWLGQALIAARADLAERQSIHSYDAYAWVCHKLGKNQEARWAISKALSTGTKDVAIMDHSKSILGR